MYQVNTYSKVTDFIADIKDLILFPISAPDPHPNLSDSPWLKELKARNIKANRSPGSRTHGITWLGAKVDLKNQKLKAKRYVIISVILATVLSVMGVLIKRHIDKVHYERKRLEDLKKKVDLNTATDEEIKEAIDISEKVLNMCAMENPVGVDSAMNIMESSILSEVS